MTGLIAVGAGSWCAGTAGAPYIHLGLLAVAMGVQASAARHASLADMTMPAATIVLHGLAHNSSAAGGDNRGSWRRASAIGALFFSAVMGTLISAHSVAQGIALTAFIIMMAGVVLLVGRLPLVVRLDRISIP
mgnify:CR=1 FL=1